MYTHTVFKRGVWTKYTYSVTLVWAYFRKICTLKSRFKSGYLEYISTEKNNCTFTSLHRATFLSLLNFNALHVKKCIVYSTHAVSFFLGHDERCLIREWIALLSDSVQGLHQTTSKQSELVHRSVWMICSATCKHWIIWSGFSFVPGNLRE